MIKFFRTIRQNLLFSGKTSKYFKYAIGEIILVVFGILIALQINNWNEQRKQNKLEQEYLTALKREFENNIKEVDRVINLNAGLLKNARELAKYTGPDIPDITEKKFAELLFGTINSEVEYRPGSGVINEILSSGKLSIFQNRELKNALASIDGLLLKIRFQEREEVSSNRFVLLEMGHDNVSMRKLAYETNVGGFGVDAGKFTGSNLQLLTSKRFDNYLLGFILTTSYLQERYVALRMQLLEIVEIIDSQIND